MSISREQILHTFLLSQKRGTAVGLRIKGRQNLLITTIERVLGTTPESTRVIVHRESIYGETIHVTQLPLHEIETITLLRVRFNDPFYENLRNLRSNIRALRQEAGLEERLSLPDRIIFQNPFE